MLILRSKEKIDEDTRQHLNKGMRQPAANDARSNAAAAPGKPTTKAMENGTAYHHKATLTSAGKHAQRFVQDDEGSSSASPTAGSQHRLFGGRQPAANASHSPLKTVAEGIIEASDRSAMYNLTEEKLLSFIEKFQNPIDNIVKPGIDLVHEMYKLAGDLSHSPQARKEFIQGIKSDLKDSIKSINKFYHEPVIDKYNDSVKFAGNGLFAGFGVFLPMKGLGGAAAGRVSELASGLNVSVKDLSATGKYSVQYRTSRMLEKNVGYNVTPDKVFKDFQYVGKNGTYITDYRAIGGILGPVKANAKYSVGLFSRNNQLSYFKIIRLERALGLKPGSLLFDKIRLTRVSQITDRHPRSPLEGNKYFKGAGQGLPGGGQNW